MRWYQEHGDMLALSHDELLITITQQSQSIRTVLWCVFVSDIFNLSLYGILNPARPGEIVKIRVELY